MCLFFTISYLKSIRPIRRGLISLLIVIGSIGTSTPQTRITFRSLEDSAAISNLVIQIYKDAAHHQIASIKVTDKVGQMMIQIPSQDSIYLLTSHLEFAPTTFACSQKTSDTVLYLRPQIFKIKEVTVKAKNNGIRVKGDTIRFDLKVFRNASQKDLKDLLKDLPGIDISKNGKITYQGKNIDKILVSGRDVVRSQFEAINRLIAPPDLATIQITPGKVENAEGDKGQYLDLILKKDTQIFLNSEVGLAHNLRTEQTGTLLSTGKQPFHHFVSISRRRLDQPAINSGDALREQDFELLRIYLHNAPLSTETLLSPSTYRMGPNDRDIGVQYNSNYFDRQDITLYLKGVDRKGHDFRNSTTTSVVNGEEIESSQLGAENRVQGILASIKWKYQISKSLRALSFIKSDYNNRKEDVMGFSSFLGNNSKYNQTTSITKEKLQILQSTQYTLTENWELGLFMEFYQNKKSSPFKARSTQPIFSNLDTTPNTYIFEYDLLRRHQRLLITSSIDYNTPPLSYGLKYTATQNSLLESGKAMPFSNTPFANVYLARKDYTHHTPRLYLMRKSERYKYNIEAGVLVYRMDTAHHTTLGSDFFLKGYFHYNISKTLKLRLAYNQYRAPLPIENLWGTPTFLSIRSFQENTPVADVYTNIVSGLFVLKYFYPIGGKFFLTSVRYSYRDLSLLGILSTKDKYQTTTYQPAHNSTTFNLKSIFIWSLYHSSLYLNLDYIRRKAQLPPLSSLGIYSYQKITQRTRYTPNLGKKSSLSLEVEVSRIQQSYALTPQSQAYTLWAPSLNFRRQLGEQWQFESKYEMIYQLPFPIQHILSGSLEFSIIPKHLSASIFLHDLLRFNEATNYTTLIQSDFIALQYNQRIGGYILVKLQYRL